MNDVENGEIFRGHLEECLKHLGSIFASRYPKGYRGTLQAKKPMADFCGVSVYTVSLWLTGGPLPDGESYIRLLCNLDFLGYKVIELERLPSGRRNFFELVGYGLISLTDAAKYLGYTAVSRLTGVLYEAHGIGKEKEQKMWDLWKEKREELNNLKVLAKEKFKLPFSLEKEPEEEDQQVTKVSAELIPNSHQTESGALAIMQGLAMMMDGGFFAKLSQAELQVLNHAFDNVIIRLSEHLNLLASRLKATETKAGPENGAG